MNIVVRFLTVLVTNAVAQRVGKALAVAALRRYAEKNDNELTHTVVDAVTDALGHQERR